MNDQKSQALGLFSPAVPIRLLIADAHPVILAGLRSILDPDPDIQIIATASNGAEAAEAALRLKPDVVLMDPAIAGMDPPPLLRTLSSLAPQSRIVLFAGPESRDYFIEALKLGCSGILLKEGPANLIAKCIRSVHSGEIWLDSHTTTAVMQEFAGQDPRSDLNRPVVVERRQVTARELEIVILIVQGYKNRDIADKLVISEQTVKNHISKIFHKLNVSDRLELALYAVYHNLHLTPAPEQEDALPSAPPEDGNGGISCCPV